MYLIKSSIILFICLVNFSANAQVYTDPIHTSKEILAALYDQAKVDPVEVTVMSLEFDYKTQFWKIELTNKEMNCIDCYPTYKFKNVEILKLFLIPHG